VKGKNNPVVVFFMIAFILAVASCSSPPPVRPALSQTVINVQRSAIGISRFRASSKTISFVVEMVDPPGLLAEQNWS
jgi:hypothetical protein